ncbi:pol polyprotein [Striga asiatica]|uniref:Pol polyprotein n=1 Tax=Striga asiatica TaxID=4170 RepID=A0A5A7PPL0_STRAF|nr:pol polyprotein [Striga asiatica]
MIPMTLPLPFAQWRIDIVGPLTQATGQRKFLLVTVDCFTKLIEVEPLARITEVKVMKFLFTNTHCRCAIPRVTLSDNGAHFKGRKVATYCRYCMGPKVSWRNLRGMVNELGSVLKAYRTTPRASKRETPFSMVYGTEAVIPVVVGFSSKRMSTYRESENVKLQKEAFDLTDSLKHADKLELNCEGPYVVERVFARDLQAEGFTRKAPTETMEHGTSEQKCHGTEPQANKPGGLGTCMSKDITPSKLASGLRDMVKYVKGQNLDHTSSQAQGHGKVCQGAEPRSHELGCLETCTVPFAGVPPGLGLSPSAIGGNSEVLLAGRRLCIPLGNEVVIMGTRGVALEESSVVMTRKVVRNFLGLHPEAGKAQVRVHPSKLSSTLNGEPNLGADGIGRKLAQLSGKHELLHYNLLEWLAQSWSVRESSDHFQEYKQHLSNVADLIIPGRKQWDKYLICQSFHPVEATNILHIPISQCGVKDKLVWHGTKNGKFSVKEAYQEVLRKNVVNHM